MPFKGLQEDLMELVKFEQRLHPKQKDTIWKEARASFKYSTVPLPVILTRQWLIPDID